MFPTKPKIKFDAINHKYYVDDKQYISVSHFINNYIPFDASNIPEHVLNKAIARGNCLHHYAEQYITFQYPDIKECLDDCYNSYENDAHLKTHYKIKDNFKNFYDKLDADFKEHDIEMCEQIVYGDFFYKGQTYKIAGTFDYGLLKKNEFKFNTYKLNIRDWKTSSEVDQLRYRLQLYFYAFLFQKTFNYKLEEIKLYINNFNKNKEICIILDKPIEHYIIDTLLNIEKHKEIESENK